MMAQQTTKARTSRSSKSIIAKISRHDKQVLALLQQEKQDRIHYRSHPLEWIVEKLKITRETIQWSLLPEYASHVWDGTPDPLCTMIDAISDGKWCAVEGGTGTSKTFVAAALALWFWTVFDDAMVITTSPREKQLELGTWKNLRTLFPRLHRGTMQTLKIQHPRFPDWKIEGLVAGVKAAERGASATRMQSIHAEHLLFIIDECPGVDQAIISALQNTCVSPHNLILALGNPDHQLDALHALSQLPNVVHVRVSGLDYPNVVLKNDNYIPAGQTELGLQRMMERYKSADNPLYLSRARGISPAQSTDALIRLEWLYAARDREGVPGLPALGVDVANSDNGDRAAIASGSGNRLDSVESFQCPNANQLGTRIAERMKISRIIPNFVGVDGTGVGSGTVNELKRLNQYVINIMSGGAPIELPQQLEKFNNLRSQMWWQFRLDVQDAKICLPDDDELFADLTTPRYTLEGGKITIESKSEIKKRLGHSPDKGDAAIYWNWVRNGNSGPVVSVTKEDFEEALEGIDVSEVASLAAIY